MSSIVLHPRVDIRKSAIALGASILAFEPAVWLIRSWSDPVWNSSGWMMGAAAFGLLLWSATGVRTKYGGQERRALGLIMASALIRLVSQILGINFVGALTLCVDFYAIALLIGTDHRSRPVSAAGLALLFSMSLPLERVVQRILGFQLQQFSREGACLILEVSGFEPLCEGLSILINAKNVLVDVPCSGARGMLTILALFVTVCCVRRPSAGSAAIGLVLTLVSAWFANAVRISLIAAGLTVPTVSQAINVMEAPWHELIGLVTLACGAVPVLLWARLIRRQQIVCLPARTNIRPVSLPKRGVLPAIIFVAIASVIVSLPAKPLDVSTTPAENYLPVMLGQHIQDPLPLNDIERQYFTEYGGRAERARYGERVVLSVSTTSPLRHLHAPDECLRAAGHRVRYLGLIDGPIPAALYRSIDSNGKHWRITATFLSEFGHVATSVSHAVWLWLQHPGMQWRMVQRIRRWDGATTPDYLFEQTLARHLNIQDFNEDLSI